MTFFAVMIEIEFVELASAGIGLIIAAQLTVCHKSVRDFVEQVGDQDVWLCWGTGFPFAPLKAGEPMKAPQLLLGVMALAAMLPGCQRAETKADVNKAASEVASNVKAETAKAGDRLVDGWLTTKIQSKFVGDRDINASDIEVSSRNGVVTLRGHVQSEPMRSLAAEIARNTDGVKHVVDQLSVTVAGLDAPLRPANADIPVATTGTAPPVGALHTDDGDARITSGIQAKYFLDDRIKSRRIDVNSSNGVVTLHGEVGSDDERAQALLLARTTDGVQRVEDNLTVMIQQQSEAATPPDSKSAPGATAEPTSTQNVDDAAVTTRLRTKLASVKGAEIQVTAKSGVILLEGTSSSAAVKERALTLARGTDGVTQIVDRIRVGKRAK